MQSNSSSRSKRIVAMVVGGAAIVVVAAALRLLVRDEATQHEAPLDGRARTSAVATRESSSAAVDRTAAPIAATPFEERRPTFNFRTLDEEGSPLPGAEVMFVANRARRLSPGSFRVLGVSDSLGVFVFKGEWRRDEIAAARSAGRMSEAVARPDPADAEAREPIPLVVRRGRRIVVLVKDEAGAPVADVRVTAAIGLPCRAEFDAPDAPLGPWSDRVAASARTDGAGRATFDGFPEGPLLLDAASLGWVGVDPPFREFEVDDDGVATVVVRRVLAVVAALRDDAKRFEWRTWCALSPDAFPNDGRHERALRAKFPYAEIVVVGAAEHDPSATDEPRHEARVVFARTDGEVDWPAIAFRPADRIDRPEIVGPADPSMTRRRVRVLALLRTPSGLEIAGAPLRFRRVGDDSMLSTIVARSGVESDVETGEHEVRLTGGFLDDLAAPPCDLKPIGRVRVEGDYRRFVFETTTEPAVVRVAWRRTSDELVTARPLAAHCGPRRWSDQFVESSTLVLAEGEWEFRSCRLRPKDDAADSPPTSTFHFVARPEPYDFALEPLR